MHLWVSGVPEKGRNHRTVPEVHAGDATARDSRGVRLGRHVLAITCSTCVRKKRMCKWTEEPARHEDMFIVQCPLKKDSEGSLTWA